MNDRRPPPVLGRLEWGKRWQVTISMVLVSGLVILFVIFPESFCITACFSLIKL